MLPAREIQETPRYVTETSERGKLRVNGSDKAIVSTSADRVADSTTGVAAALTWYEQSAQTAGREFTDILKEGFAEAI